MLTLGIISGWLLGLMVTGFAVLCVILVLTILIQRPQGGGLSGAFGSSAGSGQTAFGAKTGDALTLFTIGVFVVYILGAVGLNYAVKPAVGACCVTLTGTCRAVTTAGCPTGETFIAGVACSPNPCPQPAALTPATAAPVGTPAPITIPGGMLTPIDAPPGATPTTTPTTTPAGTTMGASPATTPPSTPAPTAPAPSAPTTPVPATPTPAPSTSPAAPGTGGNP